MAKRKKVASDVEDAPHCSKQENLGQGGCLGQLKKLERVQMKNALDSQSVNIMAPEATKPKPRPRLVLKKSKMPTRLKLQGSKNQPPASELQSQSLSSPEEDMPRSQLCGPDSQFGFVPPNVIAEADNTVEDKDGLGDVKDDLDDGKDDLDDDKDDLDDEKDDADTNDVNNVMDDSEVQSLTHSTNDLLMKKKQHACPLSPFWSADDDDIPFPLRSTNNSPMEKKKCACPISSSRSTNDGATLPPPCLKKQNGAILPPPHVKRKIHAHPAS
ncbi:hypothetical protein EDB19DRAFT_1832160 [Suillus lakei]|nr:hypothetical protein EDB19DRAFT_1832160 [Suillus lakei]